MSVNNSVSGSAGSGVDNMSENQIQMLSSSPLASFVVSDAGGTAAGSVSSPHNVAAPTAQGHNDEGFVVIAYNGPPGTTYTEDTPPSQFTDWAAYTTFCQAGPKLRVLCASQIDDDGKVVSYHETFVSKKLMSDFGGYFKAMFRSNMKETLDDTVKYQDISVEDFTRLCLCITAGGPAARNVIGKPEEIMTNLLTVYTLADRFHMLSVREWLRAAIHDSLDLNRTWMSLYHHQVLDHPPVAGAQDFHKAKVHDYVNFYLNMKDLPTEIHPIPISHILAFMAEHCPDVLLEEMWDDFEDEFQKDFGLALLRQKRNRI